MTDNFTNLLSMKPFEYCPLCGEELDKEVSEVTATDYDLEEVKVWCPEHGKLGFPFTNLQFNRP